MRISSEPASRELDRAAAVEHRPADATVDRARTNHPHPCLDICVGLLRLPVSAPDRRAAGTGAARSRPLRREHRGHRGGRRQLRVFEETVVRQRANPAKKRPPGAASDQRQVVLDEHVGDELVVAGSRRMPERLHGQSARSEPLGGSALDRRRGGRLGRCELGPGVRGEQRVDAEPASSFQPRDKQVGALELGQHGGESVRSSTASQSSAVNSPRTAAPWRNDRSSSSSAARTSLLRYSATNR